MYVDNNRSASGAVRRSDRGVVLIVAMLMLLALAGVALVGVRYSFNEVSAASNQIDAHMATDITDYGSAGTLARVAAEPIAMTAAMGAKAAVANGIPRLYMGDVASSMDDLWDTEIGGSFGMRNPDEVAPNFWTDLVDVRRISSSGGNSVDQFCTDRHSWMTFGEMGENTTVDGAPSPLAGVGAKQILIRLDIGPINCVQ